MTSTKLPDRPAFQHVEHAPLDLPPVSRLAVVALVGGILSLLASLSTLWLPLAILACGLSAVVVWKLTRHDELGGMWMAQLGLVLSTAAIAWSLTATSGRENYLYGEAANHAKVFLDVLSSGAKYEALELRRFENERQLTGTNLAAFYSKQTAEEASDTEAFLGDPLTQAVMASGPGADWQFARGVAVENRGKQLLQITVQMINRATQNGPQTVNVSMNRQLGMYTDERRDNTALWSVYSLKEP